MIFPALQLGDELRRASDTIGKEYCNSVSMDYPCALMASQTKHKKSIFGLANGHFWGIESVKQALFFFGKLSFLKVGTKTT